MELLRIQNRRAVEQCEALLTLPADVHSLSSTNEKMALGLYYVKNQNREFSSLYGFHQIVRARLEHKTACTKNRNIATSALVGSIE